MPYLENVSYSREVTIAAVRDYYQFLARMYLDEDLIREAPVGGWPKINKESLKDLDKSDEVIALLRQLPYLTDARRSHCGPRCTFADWADIVSTLASGRETACSVKVLSEGPDFEESVPSHVISLTYAYEDDDNPVFLLDTHLGVIYWPDCPSEIVDQYVSQDQIEDDFEEYSPETEWAWRDSNAWTIPGFFEVLKHQFLQLNFYPKPVHQVELVWGWNENPEMDITRDIVQSIFRRHGWPALDLFRKEECAEAVEKALEERFPDEYQ